MKVNLSAQKGSILVGTVILMLISAVLGMGFLGMASYESLDAGRNTEELKIFWKAEEGVTRAMAEMAKSGSETREQFIGTTELSPESRYVAQYNVTKTFKNGRYRIESNVFNVEGDQTDTLQQLVAEVRPQSISSHFLFFDDPGEAYFFTGDTIDGPVHSNGTINIAGSPVFTDVVEKRSFSTYGFNCAQTYGCNPEFQKDVKSSEIWDYRKFADKAESGASRRYDNPESTAEIVFAGGRYTLRFRTNVDRIDRARGKLIERTYTSAESYSLDEIQGLYFTGPVEVQGMLDGRVTIGSDVNISITDDLVYAGSDEINGKPVNGQSFLGLVSRGNVQVRKELGRAEEDNGIRINAAVIALDSAFEMPEDIRKLGNYGVMHFWGSITQRVRGTVGRWKSSRIGEGFTRKNWHFDRRLLNDGPPLFPELPGTGGGRKLAVKYWGRTY